MRDLDWVMAAAQQWVEGVATVLSLVYCAMASSARLNQLLVPLTTSFLLASSVLLKDTVYCASASPMAVPAGQAAAVDNKRHGNALNAINLER